jgi:hypothetical protein
MPTYIQTHTLPLLLIVVLAVLGVVALARLYYRKQRLQAALDEQFKSFREKAVALMDQLDALRHRHKTLPSSDPDFTVPMSGATLALYNGVEADLNGLWDRWLNVMELWNQAQQLMRSSSGLAVRQAEEARKLLDRGGIDELLRQSSSCKERLDHLNMGHEQAREALKFGWSELEALKSSNDGGTGISLPTDPHAEEIAQAESMFTQADAMIAADPIGADAIIARSRRMLRRATDQATYIPERSWKSRPGYSPLDDLAAAADAFRGAIAKLRLTNLLGVFVKFWLIVWGIGLLIGLLNVFLPVLVLMGGIVLTLVGFWVIWQVVTFWFWYGIWGTRRR